MRRNRKPDVSKYLDMRISQLKKDAAKCHSEYDRQWYNRMINELHWAKQNISADCYIEEEISSTAWHYYV